MSEKMREDFEEWFSEYSLPCEGDWFKRDSCGDYDSPSTHDAWMGWKASRAALVVELPDAMGYPLAYHEAINDVEGALYDAGVSYK